MPIPNISFSHQHSKQSELQIFELSELYQRKTLDHDPEQPHRIKFFGIIHIEDGFGTHMVDFQECQFKVGTVIFFQREQVQSFDFSNKPQGKVIVFTEGFLEQIHANMRLPTYAQTHLNIDHSPLIQLDKTEHQHIQELVAKLTEETARVDSNSLIILYLFAALSLSLQRLRPQSVTEAISKEQSERFSRFFILMQMHFDKIRDANWYALQMNITYKTLNQACKLTTGLTVKHLIDAFTILEIKRRLVVYETTTQQLANELGFEDSSNFVKYFKKSVGMTPTQFIQKYRTPTQ